MEIHRGWLRFGDLCKYMVLRMEADLDYVCITPPPRRAIPKRLIVLWDGEDSEAARAHFETSFSFQSFVPHDSGNSH